MRQEDYGDMDAEELEDIQRMKETEKKTDQCRCFDSKPVDCDPGNLNNRAGALRVVRGPVKRSCRVCVSDGVSVCVCVASLLQWLLFAH
jgi:hypothetical protein